MTELRTPRLLLRRARSDDLVAMHAVLSDERAMTYWSTPPHRDLAQTRDWLAAMMGSMRSQSEDFIIEMDGAAIGKVGAFRLPEFGFILLPAYWSRGIASEALRAFLGHAFSLPDIDRLVADVDPRNRASLALLERHGFERTGYGAGTWDTHIGRCDSVYLTLDRRAFAARRG